MSKVMSAESRLILSIRTKSWEVCPLNYTNQTWLCIFESCENRENRRRFYLESRPFMKFLRLLKCATLKIEQWMSKRERKRIGWRMVFWSDYGWFGKSSCILCQGRTSNFLHWTKSAVFDYLMATNILPSPPFLLYFSPVFSCLFLFRMQMLREAIHSLTPPARTELSEINRDVE